MRYILFGGECYYASGGFHDILKGFADLDSACRYAEAAEHSTLHEIEWWHVVDSETMEVVAESKCLPFGAEHHLKATQSPSP